MIPSKTVKLKVPIGQSGIGKSTFINTLFEGLYSRKSRHTLSRDIPRTKIDFSFLITDSFKVFTNPKSKTTNIHTICHFLEEAKTKVKLQITDTPGFHDQLMNDQCWEPILSHIKSQFSIYLKEECEPYRQRYIPDSRIHCLLYFIPPSGHSLKYIDIIALKHLCTVCNVIPLIAMSDIFTRKELYEFKERIREDFEVHNIQCYPIQIVDEDKKEINSQKIIPFAVVGSDSFKTKQLTRKTSAGVIQIENPEHCDFSLLKKVLIQTEFLKLINKTKKYYYETYRTIMLMKNSQETLKSFPDFV